MFFIISPLDNCISYGTKKSSFFIWTLLYYYFLFLERSKAPARVIKPIKPVVEPLQPFLAGSCGSSFGVSEGSDGSTVGSFEGSSDGSVEGSSLGSSEVAGNFSITSV